MNSLLSVLLIVVVAVIAFGAVHMLLSTIKGALAGTLLFSALSGVLYFIKFGSGTISWKNLFLLLAAISLITLVFRSLAWLLWGRIDHYNKILLKDFIDAGDMSPDDRRKFEQFCQENDKKIYASTRALMDEMVFYYKLNHNLLEPLSVDINLPSTEECYAYDHHVKWQEQRKSKEGKDVWQDIAAGLLCITNKRIILVGDGKTNNLSYDKILYTTEKGSHIHVTRDKGKEVRLKLSHLETYHVDAFFKYFSQKT